MRVWFRLSLVLALWFLGTTPAWAMQKTQGYCEQGNQTVTTGGLPSTTTVQRSYASCTVTVYLSGTTTLALIYSDNAGTQKTNPFTAASDGEWFFYANTGRYDVRFAATGLTTFTRGDWSTGGLLNVTTANLLPLPGNPGALVFVTDGTRGLWLDTGTQWISISGSIANVRDFGAHGNGVADDTTAIQNAITSVAAGGQVFVPAGTYKITAPLVAASNVSITGVGGASVIQVSGGIDGITYPGNVSHPISNAHVSDLVLEKVAGSTISTVAVSITGGLDASVERVIVRNNGGVWGVGFQCVDCNRYRLIDAQGLSAGNSIVVIANSSGTPSPFIGLDNQVIRGVFTDNFQGVDFQSQTDFLIEGAVIKGSLSGFSAGITLELTSLRGIIRDCVIQNGTFDGIDFEPVGTDYDVLVTGNIITGNAREGINVQTGGATFLGNFFSLNQYGIVFTGGTGAVVVGNSFRGNTVAALEMDGAFLDSVTGNKFIANTIGVRLASAPTTNFFVANTFNANGTNWSGLTSGGAEAILDANPANLRGQTVIPGGSTSVTVNTIGMPDTNYNVLCTASVLTGGPAAGSTRCYVTGKATTQFVLHSEVDPGGVASVTFDWFIIR